MTAWGLYVLLHPEVFSLSLFAVFSHRVMFDIDPAIFWGALTTLVGLVRLCALFVNGAYSRTPLIRLGTSLVSAFVWSQLVIAFWLVDQPNTGLVMYTYAVLMDLISAYRASCDVAIAEGVRIAAKSGAKTGAKSSNYSAVGVG